MLMYPGPNKSPQNHKCGFCSDGGPVSFDRFLKIKMEPSKTPIKDIPPPFPQPEGIFLNGESFCPLRFLETLRDIYERVVIRRENSAEADMSVEDLAFAQMLESRTIHLPDGRVGFRLYEGLRMDAQATVLSELVIEHDDSRFLYIQMLGSQSVPPHAGDTGHERYEGREGNEGHARGTAVTTHGIQAGTHG